MSVARLPVEPGAVVYFDDVEVILGERAPSPTRRLRVLRDGTDVRMPIEQLEAMAREARTVAITQPGPALSVSPPWRDR